jgi:hypothetical protein
MAKYALVAPDNTIIEFRNYDSPPNAVTESTIKPRLMPVVLQDVVFDTISEVKVGPVYTVLATQVNETYTKRAKTQGEIDIMKEAKIRELQAETFRRADIVMPEQEQRLYACLGTDMVRTNGLYANWPAAAKTVHDALHTRWLNARAVFQIGYDKLQEIRALTTAAQIASYDVMVGW